MDITHWKAPNIRGACFDIRLWFKVWGFQHPARCCQVTFDLQIVLDYQQNLWSGLLSKDWRLWDIPVCSHSLPSVTRLHQVWNHLENYWLLLSLKFRITKSLLPCDWCTPYWLLLSVLLATEPVSPLSEHLGEILDRGPKREYYLAWGIFQVVPVHSSIMIPSPHLLELTWY